MQTNGVALNFNVAPQQQPQATGVPNQGTMSNQQVVDRMRNILNIFQASQGHVRPHFILTGPSGSGKSFTLELLVQEFGLGFLTLNAASLTKEGTSGNSVSKALAPLSQMGNQMVVVFVDEFDKLFISGNNNSDLAHEVTNGVQNEFLKVIEGHASIFGDYGKYINVKTDNCLFVFAGAFNGEEDVTLDRLREFGVKTEFLGRVGLAYGLSKVSLAELEAILHRSPLLANYLLLFPSVNPDVCIQAIMEVVRENYELNTLGVRLLNTLLHKYFIEGGLPRKEARQVAFQRTLEFKAH